MAEIIQIDNNTWRIENGFVRFFLLEGDDKACLIDSGMTCPEAAEIAKTIIKKPLMLINTHGDLDHTSGTAMFKEIYMHKADYICCGINKEYPYTSLVEINDGDVIDLGNRPLRVIHIPGHTPGSVAFLDVNKKVLFAGDTVQKSHIFMFGERRKPEQFEGALDKLISLKDEYYFIYTSHDECIVDNDYAEKIKLVWNKVRRGEVPFEMIELLGNKVKSYTTDVCGFYLD